MAGFWVKTGPAMNVFYGFAKMAVKNGRPWIRRACFAGVLTTK